MPKTPTVELHRRRYDEWLVRHEAAHHSELLAVRARLPWRGAGQSIGAGGALVIGLIDRASTLGQECLAH